MGSTELFLSIYSHKPDPNEPLPISNRPETIYGATIPFVLISWCAISMRLWVRWRVMRDLGWDDFFVVLAGIMNTVASALVLRTLTFGFGKHYVLIGLKNQILYQQYFYAENALYCTETAIIKVSLLLQYLRIFKAGTMRWICITLICIITMWGIAFGILSWVPCVPVQGFWDRFKYPNAKCWGFGFADIDDFVAVIVSHTSTNMVFDLLVFVTPMVLFTKPNLRKKNVITMAGIFVIGAVVVFTSVWRLYTIVDTRAATKPYIDFTWWAPMSILLSCLEINLAIICASMPVFWPVLEKSVSAIFVTHEVHVTEHRRLDDDDAYCGTEDNYELVQSRSLGRAGSTKSDGGGSTRSLQRETTRDQAGYYKDAYVAAQVAPMDQELGMGNMGLETNVDSRPDRGPKWNI